MPNSGLRSPVRGLRKHGLKTGDGRPKTTNPKLPILVPLHPAVLADDHRRHGLAALNRRDVETLDAPRNRGQSELAAKRLERLEVRRRDLVEARAVRELGVARGQLHQRALVTAPGDKDPHAPAGAAGQPLFHRVDVLDLHWQVDLRRRCSQLVELAQRRLQHVSLSASDRPGIGTQLDALDDPAAADLKDLDRSTTRADLQAEHVAVAQSGGRHLLLAIAERLHGAHRIAQLRGLLEALAVRRLRHAVAERLDELVVAPLEQEPCAGHRHAVALLGADLRHARGDAALDVVFEARPRAQSRNHFVTGPDAE